MEEEAMGSGNDNDFFEISKKVISKNKYTVYIKDSIRETENLSNLLGVFRSASKEDEIYVYINSSGGWLNTAQQILNAMEDCPAKITTIADGRVASAATLIFMAGTEMEIKNNSHFMFHNYNSGVSGKGHELIQKITFQNEYYPELLSKYYKNLFTTEEIKEIIDGKDVWLSGKDMSIKLKNMKKTGVKNERSVKSSKKSS